MSSPNTISLWRGQTYKRPLFLKRDGNPINLATGVDDIIFTVRDEPEGAVRLTKSLQGTGITIVVAEDGEALLTLLPADTVDLVPREYNFDVWVIETDGNEEPAIPPCPFELRGRDRAP